MNNPNYVGPDIAKEMHDVLCKAVYSLKGIRPIPNSAPVARTEPIVHPEYPKKVGTHLWEISEGVLTSLMKQKTLLVVSIQPLKLLKLLSMNTVLGLIWNQNDLQPMLCLLR